MLLLIIIKSCSFQQSQDTKTEQKHMIYDYKWMQTLLFYIVFFYALTKYTICIEMKGINEKVTVQSLHLLSYHGQV